MDDIAFYLILFTSYYLHSNRAPTVIQTVSKKIKILLKEAIINEQDSII